MSSLSINSTDCRLVIKAVVRSCAPRSLQLINIGHNGCDGRYIVVNRMDHSWSHKAAVVSYEDVCWPRGPKSKAARVVNHADPEKKRKNLEDCRIGSIFLLFISLRWKALRFSGDRRRSVRLSIQCSLLCPINVVLKLTSRKETLALLCLYSSGVPDAYWCPHSLALLLVQIVRYVICQRGRMNLQTCLAPPIVS
ncbi:uncharacterized protein LOC110031518 [Phalaenopsis equestris]|uniref:uncharacterized protein LOC110031518 n=1 Tax=Phalaenopsis equestris TaxID=78828 RepID=UPI0009E4EEE2|nr:uncharacterized protein LOC110031518 [Phalaenopsis equestris]